MSRKKKNEVVAIVAEGTPVRMISTQELFDLWSTFHRQLKIVRGPGDKLTIYSLNDQYQDRLLALLPFMPAFEQRHIVIDAKRLKKEKFEADIYSYC